LPSVRGEPMTIELPPTAEDGESGGSARRRASRRVVPEHAKDAHGPIHRLVGVALSQPLLVAVIGLAVIVVGIWSFLRLPVDAYPDVSPPRVEITTAWPGHAAEEVERLITVPIEVEMNG